MVLPLGIFFRIMLPLSMPAIATVCVYTAVGYWNNYFSALIYINSRNLYPLAMYLRQVVVDTSSQLVDLNPEISNLNPQSVRNATVIASTVPIIIVYPFLQKYFISDYMGAVKVGPWQRSSRLRKPVKTVTSQSSLVTMIMCC